MEEEKAFLKRTRAFDQKLDVLKDELNEGSLTEDRVKTILGSSIDFSLLAGFVNKMDKLIRANADEVLARGNEATDQEIDNAIAGLYLLKIGSSDALVPLKAEVDIKKLKALKK